MTPILLQVPTWPAVPESLGTFLAWLLRASLQASVLIVLVLTLQWLLRNRLAPRWRHALWLLPAARLLLPWTPPSPTSIYNFLPMPALAARPVATEPPEAPADITTAPGVAATIPQDSASLRQPMADLGDSAVAAARGRPTGRAYLVAAWRLVPWVWLAGALSVMVLVIAQSVSLRGIRHRRLLTDQRTLELLEDCKQQMGVDTYLAVVETRRVANPALFGFVRPRLLLPAGAVTSLGPARLRHVFLHELAHLRRHDIATNWLMTLLQVLQWFNPLVWYAFARMREERELACDALALSGARPEDPQEYGRTLLHLLETGSLARRLPSLAGILESGSVIRRRINMIARFREQQTRGGAALATGLMLVLACVALAGPVATRPTSSAKAELMGRVEDFFCHNFRDITWRKSLEWGDVQTQDDGSRSIRYTYEARIWDRETLTMSQEFTFAQDGSFVRYKDVDGFPRKKEQKIADVSTQKGMIALVEGFFSENFRDITARDTIEWGPVSKDEKGNSSIRYKYVATIWGKDKKVIDQIFTFDPSGKFVSVTDTQEEAARPLILSHVDQTAEDKRSIAGSGHAVLFERPDNADQVVAVEIFGARYGDPQPPQENFHVYLLSEDRQVIANVPVPYGRIDRGDMRWRLLPMPGVKVPRKFYVALTFNPERTKGVYVGMDRNVKESHSYVGLPQEKLVPVDDRFDWMVRVHLAPAQERTAAAEQGLM